MASNSPFVKHSQTYRNDKCEPLGYRDQCNGNLQDHPHPLPSSSSCSPFWKVYQFFSMSVFWYKNDLKCCYTCNLIFRMLIFGIFYTHGMKIYWLPRGWDVMKNMTMAGKYNDFFCHDTWLSRTNKITRYTEW